MQDLDDFFRMFSGRVWDSSDLNFEILVDLVRFRRSLFSNISPEQIAIQVVDVGVLLSYSFEFLLNMDDLFIGFIFHQS